MSNSELSDLEKLQQLIDLDRQSAKRPMTEWELDRVDEWLARVERGRPLTDGQRDKLNEIWQEAGPKS